LKLPFVSALLSPVPPPDTVLISVTELITYQLHLRSLTCFHLSGLEWTGRTLASGS